MNRKLALFTLPALSSALMMAQSANSRELHSSITAHVYPQNTPAEAQFKPNSLSNSKTEENCWSRYGKNVTCANHNISGNSTQAESTRAQTERMILLGHRGFGDDKPHNSLEAFSSAASSKLTGIELDVWLTKDKVPVVFHGHSAYADVNLRRLSKDGKPNREPFTNQKVKDLYYEELLELEEKTIGASIPTLEEILKLVTERAKSDPTFIINLEIKDTDPIVCDLILEAVTKLGLESNLYLSSFHHFMWQHTQNSAKALGMAPLPFAYLKEFVQLLDRDHLIANFNEGDSFIVDHNNLVYDYDLIKDDIRLYRERGFKFGVYFPCNDPKESSSYLAMLRDEYDVRIAIINKTEMVGDF
jgi:glycerophosphoryl diester phosphodiesterase